ncbi:MAG: hypothetical protein K1W33_00690 [Clostridia bacterium]
MPEEIELQIVLDKNNKTIYIGMEDGSGAEYHYKDSKDLCQKVKFYFEFYCGVESQKESKNRNDNVR